MSSIRMDHDLDQKPEVRRISHDTGLSILTVIGCLWKVWSWFDSQSENGVVVTRDVTRDMRDIDFDVSYEGFCAAMEKEGWLIVGDGFLELPGFAKKFCNSVIRKAQATERQRRKRAKARREMPEPPQSVTRDMSVTVTRDKSVTSRAHVRAEGVVEEGGGGGDPPLTRAEIAERTPPTEDEILANPILGLRKSGCTRAKLEALFARENSGAERFEPASWVEAYLEDRMGRGFQTSTQTPIPLDRMTTIAADTRRFAAYAKNNPEQFPALRLRAECRPKPVLDFRDPPPDHVAVITEMGIRFPDRPWGQWPDETKEEIWDHYRQHHERRVPA